MFKEKEIVGFKKYSTSDDVDLARVVLCDDNSVSLEILGRGYYNYSLVGESLAMSPTIYQRVFKIPETVIRLKMKAIINEIMDEKQPELIKIKVINVAPFLTEGELKELKIALVQKAKQKVDDFKSLETELTKDTK